MTRPAIKVEIVYAVKVTYVSGGSHYINELLSQDMTDKNEYDAAIMEARRVSGIMGVSYQDNTEGHHYPLPSLRLNNPA